MFKFLQKLFTINKEVEDKYDEYGERIPGELAMLPDSQLMIPARSAQMMRAKALDDLRKQCFKKVFYQIHKSIKVGHTAAKVEAVIMRPEIMEYFINLGYVVSRVTPPDDGIGRRNRIIGDEFDELTGEPIGEVEPYHFYVVSWTPETN